MTKRPSEQACASDRRAKACARRAPRDVASARARRPLALAALLAAGCRCDGVDAVTAPPLDAPATATTAAATTREPPGREPVGGLYCPGEGRAGPAPEGAFVVGGAWLRTPPGWLDPPDDSARHLVVPGIRDVARRADDGALLVRHPVAGERFAVLTAKAAELPEGATFDVAGAHAVIAEVAASPEAALLGVRALRWGGRRAVEGVVSAYGARTRVHHLVVETGPRRALDVALVAPAADYASLLDATCQAVGAAP